MSHQKSMYWPKTCALFNKSTNTHLFYDMYMLLIPCSFADLFFNN